MNIFQHGISHFHRILNARNIMHLAYIYPNNYAVWVEQVEIESDKSVQEQVKDL